MAAKQSKPILPSVSAPTSGCSRWTIRLSAFALITAVVLAYVNTLSAPFVFDDQRGIVENESIRQLWPLHEVLIAPPQATGAAGRPVVNLSLALNYALGGLDVRGYHALNIALHACAALVLFGLLRRSFLLPALNDKFGAIALPLSAGIAALWALHPLLTESVSCVIQRTEILGGLFYLLVLYAFVRNMEAQAWGGWRWVTVAACFVGMAAKEIVATAPVIVLLFDRTLVAGTFAAAWRLRRRFYLMLAASWLMLVGLMLTHGNRGGSVGFGYGVSAWEYALTQCKALVLYLKLSLWPHPLVMDYGTAVVTDWREVWWQGVVVLALVGATFRALVKRPAAGLVAFTAFAILAPSSSFLPLVTQTIAEHRMYLPLAGVLILLSCWLGQHWPRWAIPAILGGALIAGGATHVRNQDYRSGLAIWGDTVEKQPDNPRARLNYGTALSEAKRVDEAMAQFKAALRLKPDYVEAEYNLGNALVKQGDFSTAAAHYARAVELSPEHAQAHYALGYCLLRTGDNAGALRHYARAEALRPDDAVILRSHASALTFTGQLSEAESRYRKLIELTPTDGGGRAEYGVLLARLGRGDAAQTQLTEALRLEPGNSSTRYALGRVLMDQGRWAEAAEQLRVVVRARPGWAEAREALAEAELRRDLQR